MAVLTLDVGGAALSVDCEKGGHAPPRKVGGDRQYAFPGTENPTTLLELMVVPVILAPLPTATVATIRAMFALGAQVPCSGDVFNKAGTIVCSGSITDELHETGDRWTLTLTLYEIASWSATVIPDVYLANLPDDDTGAEKKAWTTVEGGFANIGSVRLLDAATLTECGGSPDPTVNCPITYTDPGSEEISWLSTAFLAAGTLYGRPSVGMLSIGGTGDKWQTQNCRAVLELVRASVVVFTLTTDYAADNGGFAGGSITMPAFGATAVEGAIGDRVRVRLQARIGLHGGYTDGNDGSNLDRQTVTYGYSGAGTYYSWLKWGGLADCLDPTP